MKYKQNYNTLDSGNNVKVSVKLTMRLYNILLIKFSIRILKFKILKTDIDFLIFI